MESEPHSQLGLDGYETSWQKGLVTAVTMFLGAVLARIASVLLREIQPPWRLPAFFVAELLSGIFVLALVYLWWRPPAVQRMYLFAERQVLRIVRAIGVLAIVIVVLFGAGLLVRAIRG